MKCPTCGAWSEVLDTRQGANEVVRRRRRCANDHTFPTVEVLPVMVNKVHQAASLRSVVRRRALWKRDQQIVADPRPARAVGLDYGLSLHQVQRIRQYASRRARA